MAMPRQKGSRRSFGKKSTWHTSAMVGYSERGTPVRINQSLRL
jgi:hypothetical protein